MKKQLCSKLVQGPPELRGRNRKRGLACGKRAVVYIDDRPLCFQHAKGILKARNL